MARNWASLGLLTASLWGSSCGRDATEFRRIELDDRTTFDTTEDARPLEQRPAEHAALSGLNERTVKSADDTAEKTSQEWEEENIPHSRLPAEKPARKPLPLDPQNPNKPVLPAEPDAPGEPELPVEPVPPEQPADTIDPVDPIVPERRTVSVSFGQMGSVATYISCAQMTLTSSSGQGHIFDLSCSENPQSGGHQPQASVDWTDESNCLSVSIAVQTYRSAADLNNGGPYWERTLSTEGSSSDKDYFRLADNGEGSVLIGYEDLPLPYDLTDQDHDDLILNIAVTGDLDLRFPPLTSDCEGPYPEAERED